MSLLEVIVAALVLAGASMGSLQLWSQAGQLMQRVARREDQQQAVALQMLATPRWLSSSTAQQQFVLISTSGCRFDLDAVERAAEQSLPLPQGLQRRWREHALGHGLWLELESELVQRHQLLTPAATGWCQPSNAPDASHSNAAPDSGEVIIDPE